MPNQEHYVDPAPETKIGRMRGIVFNLLQEHVASGTIPTNARFLFYELVARGILSKEKDGARPPDHIIHSALTDLREQGAVPWNWIIDETRFVDSFAGAENLQGWVDDVLDQARLDPWAGQVPFVLTESRALAGALRATCDHYAVQLAATNGQCGGFLRTDIAPRLELAATVLYFGDWDLSGGDIEQNTKRVLEYEVGELKWERVALTEQQVKQHRLPKIIKHDRRFRDGRGVHEAVETEALSQQLIVDLLKRRLDALLPEPCRVFLHARRDNVASSRSYSTTTGDTMARTIRDVALATRAQRARLPVGKKPHWSTLIAGQLHLGYRRRSRDSAGKWLTRKYLGRERYMVAPLGVADDFGTGMTHAEAVRQALAHKGRPLRRDGPTVADAIERHARWMRSDRPVSADEFERIAEHHILPLLGATPLARLTTDQIIRWRDKLAAAPAYNSGHEPPTTDERRRARRASTNRVWTVLRAALNSAFEHELVDTNAAWKRMKPLKNTIKARKRFLSVEESQRLINAADAASGFRALVHAALLTGCRYSELGRLQVQDFKHGKVHITQSKSGRERWITLTEEGIEFFRAITLGRGGDEPLLRRYGDKVWKKDEQQYLMAKAVAAARLTPRATFHSLRHTYASLSVMGGMPLMVLARNLGHVDVTMVVRHYGHLENSYVDAEIQKAAPRFGLVGKSRVIAASLKVG
jgi:integrase